MGGAYLIMALVIIITNISLVPEAIVTMFKSAFDLVQFLEEC